MASLQALDADFMKDITILKQSEAILAESSNYWISVINVGRHFALDDVMGMLRMPMVSVWSSDD